MLACCYRYHVSKCIFLYLCTRVEKIHLDTTYLNVSFCIFPPRSERYIKIHLDWFRYTCIQFAVSTQMKSNGCMKRHVFWSKCGCLSCGLVIDFSAIQFFGHGHKIICHFFLVPPDYVFKTNADPLPWSARTQQHTYIRHLISHDSSKVRAFGTHISQSIHSSNFCTKKENCKNIDFSKS